MIGNYPVWKILCASIAVGAFVLLSNACGGGGPAEAGAASAGAPGADQRERGVPVKIVQLNTGTISEFITETSTIEAEQSVDVYARVTGEVVEINIEEGKVVDKNVQLCKLEDQELKLAEEKAKTDMEEAERLLNRVKTEFKNKVVAQIDLDTAQHKFDLAENEWKIRKTYLDRTTIVAPIKGRVSERLVRLGQKVDPSTKLYTMFNQDSLVVNIHISEGDYFAKVAGKEKQIKAWISSKSLPDKQFPGTIKRVAPIVDSNTNTIKLTISYNDPNGELLPGMFVNVRLITETHENAVLVPNDAIVYDNELQYVFVAKGESAERVLLKPGFRNERFVEAVTDLKAGDQVIVIGQSGLKEGSKIRVVDESGNVSAEAQSPSRDL
jgi:membrane fusion protein (multidrug efflux system)